MARQPTPEALGAAVRALRQERQLTIEELADQAGLHWTYLSEIERGQANPTILKLAAIAGVLELRLSEVLEAAENDA